MREYLEGGRAVDVRASIAKEAAHLVERPERIGKKIERREATRGVEGRVAKRQRGGIGEREAQVADGCSVRLAHGSLQHRP